MTQEQINIVNAYVPVFMPEGTVRWAGYGHSWPIQSAPWCLGFDSAVSLLAVLAAEGIPASAFLATPWPGPGFSQQVPWLKFANGAIINAGEIAVYFNHNEHPFVGSSGEIGLLADIANRVAQAGQGNTFF